MAPLSSSNDHGMPSKLMKTLQMEDDTPATLKTERQMYGESIVINNFSKNMLNLPSGHSGNFNSTPLPITLIAASDAKSDREADLSKDDELNNNLPDSSKIFTLSVPENETSLESEKVDRATSLIRRVYKVFPGLVGVIYTFLSALFFTVTTVIVKHLHHTHPGAVACFRFGGIFVMTLPLVCSTGQNIFGPANARSFIILRGLAGATSLYLRYSTLHYLPIANATILVVATPVFVCIFARIFLKEPFGWFHVITLAISLLGIGFTARLDQVFTALTGDEVPDEDGDFSLANQLYGFLTGFGATIFGASTYVLVRRIKHVHHSIILWNFSWVAFIEMAIVTYSLDGFALPECSPGPWLLIALAVLSFYGQMLLTKALQIEEAGLVSLTRSSSEVLLAFVFQIFVFTKMPDKYAIVGASLVTGSVCLTGVRKSVMNLPKDHRMRKIFAFTLK